MAEAVGPFSEQRAALNRSLEELLFGGADPAAALAEAQAVVDEALEEYAEASF